VLYTTVVITRVVVQTRMAPSGRNYYYYYCRSPSLLPFGVCTTPKRFTRVFRPDGLWFAFPRGVRTAGTRQKRQPRLLPARQPGTGRASFFWHAVLLKGRDRRRLGPGASRRAGRQSNACRPKPSRPRTRTAFTRRRASLGSPEGLTVNAIPPASTDPTAGSRDRVPCRHGHGVLFLRALSVEHASSGGRSADGRRWPEFAGNRANVESSRDTESTVFLFYFLFFRTSHEDYGCVCSTRSLSPPRPAENNNISGCVSCQTRSYVVDIQRLYPPGFEILSRRVLFAVRPFTEHVHRNYIHASYLLND